MRLVSKTVRAGDNSLSATTGYTYNDRGDVTAVDGPLAGSNDVVQSYYDASRWEIGQVAPDPDGSGPALYRASKTDYRADGQAATSSVGVVASLAAFPASFQSPDAGGQRLRRPGAGRAHDDLWHGWLGGVAKRRRLDILGRSICSTVRMNPAVFTTSTAAACDLGPLGTDGEDRITYTEYDALGRLTKVTSGYKSATPRVEKAVTAYTANSKENPSPTARAT